CGCSWWSCARPVSSLPASWGPTCSRPASWRPSSCSQPVSLRPASSCSPLVSLPPASCSPPSLILLWPVHALRHFKLQPGRRRGIEAHHVADQEAGHDLSLAALVGAKALDDAFLGRD